VSGLLTRETQNTERVSISKGYMILTLLPERIWSMPRVLATFRKRYKNM